MRKLLAVILMCVTAGAQSRAVEVRGDEGADVRTVSVDERERDRAAPKRRKALWVSDLVRQRESFEGDALTGVGSRSSSVAEAAASIRSSHRFPYPARDEGSADMAFRSELARRWWSLDRTWSGSHSHPAVRRSLLPITRSITSPGGSRGGRCWTNA